MDDRTSPLENLEIARLNLEATGQSFETVGQAIRDGFSEARIKTEIAIRSVLGATALTASMASLVNVANETGSTERFFTSAIATVTAVISGYMLARTQDSYHMLKKYRQSQQSLDNRGNL